MLCYSIHQWIYFSKEMTLQICQDWSCKMIFLNDFNTANMIDRLFKNYFNEFFDKMFLPPTFLTLKFEA